MRKSIAATLLEVMREQKRSHIYYGDHETLGECASRCGFEKMHPMDAQTRVMAAVRGSNLFKHAGKIRAHNSRGHSRLIAIFEPQVNP